jgi:MinD superfamily P-loop ATPase
MAPPVIRAVLDRAPADHTLVMDAPPGTSCPVIESVKTAHVVLLVTEPTPFGLNDLKLAVDMVRELGLPFGVAVNRVGIGDQEVFEYCRREEIPVLMEALPRLRPLFLDLAGRLADLARTRPRRFVRPARQDVPDRMAVERTPSETLPPGQRADAGELVVISGKGGTGKTSIVASFFALAGKAAVADCDVDAADLHLVLDPVVRSRWPFSGGSEAVIDATRCTDCGLCVEHCRFDAITVHEGGSAPVYEVDRVSCEGCGVCADICPDGAVSMVASTSGEWYVSDTRHGPMVHARLGIAQENSGKLVSLVRKEGKALTVSSRRGLMVCDGSPGIGCPVIASIAGARMVLIVTEPTLSGFHDLKRVAELTRQFNIKTGVCINKVDINPEISGRIQEEAAAIGLPMLGCIRYDDSVTTAQVSRLAVVEHGDGPAATDIRALWERVKDEIE